MKYQYYGDISELNKDIKNICKKYDIKLTCKNSGYILNKDTDKAMISIEKDNAHLRSFSAAFPINPTLILNIKNGSEMIIDLLEQLCNTYTDTEINSIIRDMPLLDLYSNRFRGQLKNIAIIWRDHFLEENIGLLQAFVNCGVNPEDILALDKGDSTRHRKEISNTFRKLSFNVEVFDNSKTGNKEYQKRCLNILDSFISHRKDKKIIILDDGALITEILSYKQFNNIIGVIELTEMGLRRIKSYNKDIKVPIINVAKTRLKRQITYKEIANSIFIRILELLGAIKTIGRKILILGYGDLGARLADCFKSYGMNVIIYDKDIFQLIVAAEQGYTTYKSAIDAIKIETPCLIVGASGYKSITYEMLENLKNNTYVTAGATADLAIFNELEYCSNTNNYGKQYVFNGKKITVLGNGRSVNLFESESIPNQANDIFKTSSLLAALLLKQNHFELKNGIQLETIENWLTNSGIYQNYYDLYFDSKQESI